MSEQLVLHRIAISTMAPSRWQPREAFDAEELLELAKHIRDHGLMYPVIVWVNERGENELIAGERRTRAMTALALIKARSWVARHGNGLRKAIEHVAREGWTSLGEEVQVELVGMAEGEIEARIEADGDRRRLHELAVADNIQRKNLSALEEARALQGLIDEYELTQREVATMMGWSQGKVQQRLSLLGTVEEAREALNTRVISASHLRHIAQVPEALQGAVTREVVSQVQRAGDQSATVRQVANLAREVREFVKPQRWVPTGDGRLEKPRLRNRYRLMRHLVGQLALDDELGERLLGLRDTGWGRDNLLGKRAETIVEGRHLATVLSALMGTKKADFGSLWRQAAGERGWTCESCRLCGLPGPGVHRYECQCVRWESLSEGEDPEEAGITTCEAWQGKDEALVLPATDRAFQGWVERLGLEGMATEPFAHFTEAGLYAAAIDAAMAARAEQMRQAQEEENRAHLGPMEAYWGAQREGLVETTSFQAHLCERCTSYRKGLLEAGLPPCEYAVEPLKKKYGNRPKAPEYGVLVDEGGRMLPRCVQFRANWEWLKGVLLPSAGFALPDRTMVLEWMGRMATGRTNQTTHNYTLGGPLAWLPYEREDREQVYDVQRLRRFVRRVWKELGDERVATLLAVLCSEVKAGNRMRMPFKLLDPSTGVEERWAAVSWENWQRGEDNRYWGRDSWPTGWGKPWLRG